MVKAPPPLAPVAPWWRPDRFAANLPHLRARERMRKALRAYFADQGFEEVDTAAVQITPGLGDNLLPFSCPWMQVGQHQKTRTLPRTLHTSPELAMKKLLVAGMTRIFQISHVFRNGEGSTTHHPEFSMLEWYRVGAQAADLRADCAAIVRAAAVAAGGGGIVRYQGRTADVRQTWEVLTMQQAFERYAKINLRACLPDNRDRLAEQAQKIGIQAAPDDTFSDVFFKIFLSHIEHRLGEGQPTILTDYPACMAALGKLKPDDPLLADRFEVYICGVELANACSELTDPHEHQRRLNALLSGQTVIPGHAAMPIDPDFIQAIQHGLPDCAGCALGFDRLVLLLTGAKTLENVLWSPVQ